MEPLLGGASFVLLGFQFARAQLDKLGLKPYTEVRTYNLPCTPFFHKINSGSEDQNYTPP